MNRSMAAKRRARELTTPVGDHFIDVHVELRAAAGHPDMQGEHVVMPPTQNFVTSLSDQLVSLIIKPVAVAIGDGSGLLQYSVSCDHFARNQVLTDAEMLQRALRLCTPKLVRRNLDHA